MSIRLLQIPVTTTGTAGAATGTADSNFVTGFVHMIYLDFHASAPGATTDTTISYKTRGGNILAVSNSATDAMFHPRATCVNNANSAITNSFSRFFVNDKITVTVAQSDALTNCVIAYIWIDTHHAPGEV